MTYTSKWARLVCAAVAACTLGRLLLAYDALPAQMASHFNLAGRANGFMPKDAFIALMVLLQLVMPVLLAIILHKTPHGLVSLPYRNHWFAPERCAASLARLGALFDAMVVAVTLLLAMVAELTVRANLGGGSLPEYHWLLLVLFGAFMIGWLVRTRRAFPRPLGDHSASMP